MAENARGWTMTNTDFPDEVIQGQFPAEDLTENVRAVYSQFNTLNRQNPALQWIRGELDDVTFTGRVYQDAEADLNPRNQIALLKSFARRDESLRRPPVIAFSVGDGFIDLDLAVVREVTGITYDFPTEQGAVRGATFNVRLTRFVPFTIAGGEITDSRFARVRTRDYYESLAEREYNDPLLGVLLQRDNPDKPNLLPGDVVKLPSLRSIRLRRVTADSPSLRTAFGRQETDQRANLLDTFKRRSASRFSHIVS